MEKNKKTIPGFSHLNRDKVPREFTWNAEDIYTGFEEWQEDKTLLQIMIKEIKVLSENWESSPQNLLRLLNHIDETEKKISALSVYCNLFSDTDMGKSLFQSMKGEIHFISVELQRKLSFLEPGILKLGKEKINKYMTEEPRLNLYALFFDAILGIKKHILPADKEEIAVLTGLFSESAEKAAAMLNNIEIPFPTITLSGAEKVKLNQQNYILFREAKNRNDRHKVMRTYWKYHARFKNTQAALLDSEIKNHFFHAAVHRYKNCLEAALFPKKIATQVYYNLIDTVKENLAPLHRFLKLKTRLLHLDSITYDDIYASSVPAVEKIFTIEEAKSLILEALKPLGTDYEAALTEGFKNRWMDIYPNKGKRSGAYSNGGIYDRHPYVLMNYNGTFDTVSTLAHEFGHALHSYFSNKAQPYPTAHYPIFLAEIASTFNEALLVDYLVATQDDDMLKLFILDQYVEGIRGTLYRQALFADFELAMHREVEKGNTLTHEWLDQKYLELTRLYYGHEKNIMNVDRYIQNEWSAIPHFYYNFYVYQYSTGIAAATALSGMVLKGGKAERTGYLNFLKAGGSDYPLNTLNKAGVDLTTPAPIVAAIKRLDQLIDEMEKIAKRLSLF